MYEALRKAICLPIRILKFGGTSVANTERLSAVAQKIQKLSSEYHLIVVVSAMSGVTNQLVAYCDQMAPSLKDEEVDVVLASGEQVTSGLLSLRLKSMGIDAQSLMNWQSKLLTTPNPTQARIEDLDAHYLITLLSKKIIPVLAGFQGINNENRITTLGRGGSDTTAVAVAASVQNYLIKQNIKPDVVCDIYTDVDGIYTADPRFVEKARKLTSIPAPYMLELAQAGSKVLHSRSVQLALKHTVNVRVLSSFCENEKNVGTLITQEKEKFMEKSYVFGIAHHQNDYLVCLNGKKECIQTLLKEMSALYLHTDLLALSCFDKTMQLSFMMLDRDVPILQKHIEKENKNVDLKIFTNKVKITLVGVGLQNDCDILNKIYMCTDQLNASIDLLSISELKISIVVDQSFTRQLLKKLHHAFILDENPS
ncbi:MAG: Aspartate kinase Ask_LysC [Holosporales bacterium]